MHLHNQQNETNATEKGLQNRADVNMRERKKKQKKPIRAKHLFSQCLY